MHGGPLQQILFQSRFLTFTREETTHQGVIFPHALYVTNVPYPRRLVSHVLMP